jgi:4-amino-4-deoxy-L-arabinose transferase-like glycosyltransferase
MKNLHKNLLTVLCILGAAASFLYHIRLDPDAFGEVKAPVHVNIEIDKEYANDIAVVAVQNAGDYVYGVQPTTAAADIRTVVVYTEIKHAGGVPFVHELYLRVPQAGAEQTLGAVDNACVFIGNKTFYFSYDEIAALRGEERDGFSLYRLSGLRYETSCLGSWINWYGDFNLAVKAFFAFFLYPFKSPFKFFITWGFLLGFFFLHKEQIAAVYHALKTKNSLLLEALLLALVVIAGFCLRFNGYVRGSSWRDELYSACVASNPNRPFLSAFEDPGNPPFYFIILRFWFIVFGWTEQSGRFLSVLAGSAAIVSLYALVKRLSGKKAALLAALFMAGNMYLVGFSQEMRGYIFEVFLVPVVAYRFFAFLERKNAANLILYIVPSILLVNTHYYGSFLIFANFLFFIFLAVTEKKTAAKELVPFFLGNVLIALTLAPFLVYTAFQKALLNPNFDTHLSKPNFMWKGFLLFVPFLVIMYLVFRRHIFQKRMTASETKFLDYMIFAAAFIFLAVICISFKRSMLSTRYFVILYPFLLAFIALVFIAISKNFRLPANAVVLAVLGIYFLLTGYEFSPGGGTDPFLHEIVAYTSHDAAAHPENTSTTLFTFYWAGGLEIYNFYKCAAVPPYIQDAHYNVLYKNGGVRDVLPGNSVQIRIGSGDPIVKIYQSTTSP